MVLGVRCRYSRLLNGNYDEGVVFGYLGLGGKDGISLFVIFYFEVLRLDEELYSFCEYVCDIDFY